MLRPRPADSVVKLARKTLMVCLYDIAHARVEDIADYMNVSRQCVYGHLREFYSNPKGLTHGEISNIKNKILSRHDY